MIAFIYCVGEAYREVSGSSTGFSYGEGMSFGTLPGAKRASCSTAEDRAGDELWRDTAGCGCQEVLLLAKWCLTSEVSNPTTGTVRNEGRGTVPSSLHSAQLTHRVPARAMLGATCGMRERATPRCLLDGAEHQGIYSRFCILTCGEWGRLTGCYQKCLQVRYGGAATDQPAGSMS